MLVTVTSLAILCTFSSCDNDDDIAAMSPVTVNPDLVFYGLSNSNSIIKYNANNSSIAIQNTTITGLAAGEKIMAIDFRPATGQLYGLGNSSRLYIIHPETGAATAIGAAPFTPAIGGSLAGFDFNPTVDRIRLVTSAGQNLRLHPETGAVVATDGNLNPGSPAVAAAAYTHNVAGASSTTLFVLDPAAGKMYKQDPPNNGTLADMGSLGFTAGNEGGFDISPDNMVALAAFSVGANSVLYQVDLSTGKATRLGNLAIPLIGIAIPTLPVAYTVDMSNNLQIFNPNNPGTPVAKAITGLQAGESVLGIDLRPATGQLYALGSSSRLYTINTATGAAAAVSVAPFAALLSGTSFGFDFNPTVDRIRVVSNTGQNLRLNPVTGDIAAVDLPLNPSGPAVSGAAYTNNFPGATTTVLFDIDPATDKLYTQVPPNNGTLVETGPLGIDISSENGFDIGGNSNRAWAVLTTPAGTKLYTIQLTTGTATEAAVFTHAVRGFAVGLGF